MMSLSVRVKTRLLQLIQQLGDDPTRFVRDPKKDFTRQSRLSLTTVVSIILSMGASSLKRNSTRRSISIPIPLPSPLSANRG